MDEDRREEVEKIMGLYRRSSREEALALAKSFQVEGRYQYFRGQTRNVPAVASFYRLDAAGKEAATERHARLEHWIDNTPGLEDLRNNGDHMLAVGQHYGLPTPFLDFTTDPEVAAYFATCVDGKGYSGEESCIICLDFQDITEFLRHWGPDLPRVEMLHLTVPNLWRIESQCGVFLHCPIVNFETHIYGFDRIIFPQSRDTPSVESERIYPVRKSSLENLLEEYFYLDMAAQSVSRWRSDTRFKHVHIAGPIKGSRSLLKTGELPPVHESWNKAALKSWLDVPTEMYSDVLPDNDKQRVLVIGSSIRAEDLQNQEWLLQVVSRPNARELLLDWLPASKLIPSSVSLGHVLNRIWDGMRCLPYTDQQISAALRNAVLLGARSPQVHKMMGVRALWEDFTDLFGSNVEIEVGTPMGAGTRGLVPSASLRRAVRDDIEEFVDFEGYGGSTIVEDQMTRIMQAAYDVRTVYVFERLCDVFAEFMIPTQVIANPKRALNLFSPARLDVLGLP